MARLQTFIFRGLGMLSGHQILKKVFAIIAAGCVAIFCNLVVILDVGGIRESRHVILSHLGF